MNKHLLVVGGAGYIGSHMLKCLLEAGHEVVILDDLSTGFADSLLAGALIFGDCGDRTLLDRLFAEHRFDGVLHVASLIQVGESVRKPAKYYRNNTAKTLTLIEAMADHGVGPLVFSSTAAVFGGTRIQSDRRGPSAGTRQPVWGEQIDAAANTSRF